MSFIELLVVIAIVSLLFAVGGPSYESYLIKSRFAQVFAAVNQFRDDMEVAYTDNDQFPATFGQVTVNTYTTVASNVLTLLYYGRSTNMQAAYVSFYTANLGVTGYVAANSSGAGGNYCRVTLAAIPNATGQMQFYCGQWDGSSTDVPLTELPQSCQNTNISALIT